jgi:hypothetical protein
LLSFVLLHARVLTGCQQFYAHDLQRFPLTESICQQ